MISELKEGEGESARADPAESAIPMAVTNWKRYQRIEISIRKTKHVCGWLWKNHPAGSIEPTFKCKRRIECEQGKFFPRSLQSNASQNGILNFSDKVLCVSTMI